MAWVRAIATCRRLRRSGVLQLLRAGILALVAGSAAADQARAQKPDDAMAFIRVSGDLHAEFVDVYRNPIDEPNVEYATGSGFVIAPSGLVLTNQHVVDGSPVALRIQGHDAEVRLESRRIEVAIGEEGSLGVYDAWVVAEDPDVDLAVLQVTAADLPYIPFGDSDVADPGQAVRVLGFPFGRKVEVGKRAEPTAVPRPTVTTGTVSATRADDAGATRYLQTDAAVNPGNSGGPMVDEDGYALGVVRSKLAPDARSRGAGFGIPINLVKDFLDAHGLLGQLPAERLYPGVVHTLDWKKLRIELPDGFSDTSPGRLFVDTGWREGGVSVEVARLATPWEPSALEKALLAGQGWGGFVPGPMSGRGRSEERSGRRLGSARGEGRDERPYRVEYAILGLTGETVVARYLGAPDEIAFNLSLVRRSLETLEAEPLLTDEVRAPLRARFEPAAYPGGAAGAVELPAGWSREPASQASCATLPAAEAGMATSPPGDFTVVLRALRWRREAVAPGQVAQACGGRVEEGREAYAGRFERLGVALGSWGTVVEDGAETVLLEAEAPQSKLPFVRDLYVDWVRRATVGR